MKYSLTDIEHSIISFLTPERVNVYPMFFLAVSLLFWLVLLVLGNGVVDMGGNVIGNDFISFYTAGHFLNSDKLHLLYNHDAQLAYQTSIVGKDPGLNAFLNPPFTTILYAPFANFSYLTGYLLWSAVGISLFVYSLFLIRKNLLNGDYTAKEVALMAFCFWPVINWVAGGQATGFIFFILVTTFILLRNNREYFAGFMLGLLAFKPQIALGLAIPILIKGRWRAILGGITSVSLWLSIGFLIFPEQMHEYRKVSREIISYLTGSGYPFWGIRSIFGFSHLLFHDVFPSMTGIMTAALSIIAIVWVYLVWKPLKWDPSTSQWNLTMAISQIVGLSLAIHLFTYDLAILLIPFFIILAYIKRASNESYLDAGPVYIWTIIVYITSCFGASLSDVQLYLTKAAFGFEFAIQFNTIAMIIWAIYIHRHMFLNNEICMKQQQPVIH